MRHDQAVAYSNALRGCAVGSDEEDPDCCAVIVGRRWCWTEPELFAALDPRARDSCQRPGPGPADG